MHSPSHTFGLDLGDKVTVICTLDAHGEVIEVSRVRTRAEALKAWFEGRPTGRAVVETSTHSRWVEQVLVELGHEVIVANPRQLGLIFGSRRKNDARDAEHLARLGRMDPRLLCPIQHRSDAAQKGLLTVKVRKALVATRTRLVTAIRALAKSFGHRVSKADAAYFVRRAREELPPEILEALEPLCATLESLQEQIGACDEVIEALGRHEWSETTALRQVTGVGPVTALAFVLTLEDKHRFPTSRDVGAYLGLVPAQDQSGDTDRRLGITKTGDRLVRTLLVQAAHYILGPFGPDTDLRRWGLRRIEHGMNKKKALVALARKLAVLLHRLWVTGATYQPLRNAERTAAMT